MKFNLTYTSDPDRNETIEVNTLEELMALYHEKGQIIIRHNTEQQSYRKEDRGIFAYFAEGVPEIAIEVYDSWRE